MLFQLPHGVQINDYLCRACARKRQDSQCTSLLPRRPTSEDISQLHEQRAVLHNSTKSVHTAVVTLVLVPTGATAVQDTCTRVPLHCSVHNTYKQAAPLSTVMQLDDSGHS
jgi:hypothetical protein